MVAKKEQNPANLVALLQPYKGQIVLLFVLAVAANGLTLWLPRLLSQGIDAYYGNGIPTYIYWAFGVAAAAIFILTYLQSIAQTYVSERVARDLRNELSEKISSQTFVTIQKVTPAKLLTNLTSDIDSVKNYVAQAVVNIISALFLIVGGSVMLLSIDWKLGLAVLAILPVIGLTFFFVFKRVRKFFLQLREVIDWLNKVINESILGAALIRVVHSQEAEHEKFEQANRKSREVGMDILNIFSTMMPVIMFISNCAVLIILVLGGHFVISHAMTLGNFAAFNTYLTILIFPVFILGFVSNIIAQAQASYGRIYTILALPKLRDEGTITTPLTGRIDIEEVSLTFGEKKALKNVSLHIAPGNKVAIIGPTAAGKTQLLNLLVGLLEPTHGRVAYDGHLLSEYHREELYKQVGLVFQDSSIFNISLRENIAFNTHVSEEYLQKSIAAAELSDLIASLPHGLDTIVSERGTSLSGGQKQRVMLARALAINPKILLLDDFTARVDITTEKRILDNVMNMYPGITLISVTQKVTSVEQYDQIVVLMEGEVIATGTHTELMESSPEYVQICHSQKSTNEL